MSPAIPVAPDDPVALGTPVRVDPSVSFYGRELVAGGSPWRLLRLSGVSISLLERWRNGGEVGMGEGRFARTLVARGFLTPTYPPTSAVDNVDIVVPVRDDAARLDALLASVPGLPVTVVDDGSTDPGAVAAVAARHGARLVTRSATGGPAAARNVGLAATDRPFVWFVDVDVQLDAPRGTLSRLLAPFGDPTVAAVAPRVRGAGGPGARERFEATHGPLDLGPRSALVVPGGRVSYVPSACLLVRRAAMGSGFEEALRHGEDVDLVWRLHDAGWLVRYDASTSVTHATRPTVAQWWSQRHEYGRSAASLAELHPGRLAPLRADAWTIAAWAALLARQPRVAAGVIAAARRILEQRLPANLADRTTVANLIAVRNMGGAGGPLARNVVRTYGPALLVGTLHKATRPVSLIVFGAGTLWRWHDRDVRSLADVPWAILDDLAYATGLWRGALERRAPAVVLPKITGSVRGVVRALRAASP